MKETGEPVQGSIVSNNENQHDFEYEDEERAFWKKESMPYLGPVPRAGRPPWHLCVLLSVSATVLLALVIALSVSNAKVDRKFSTSEKTMANLSSSVTSLITQLSSGMKTDINLHTQINQLKVSLETAESQVVSVTKSLQKMDDLELLVSQLKCNLDKVLYNITTQGCCPVQWKFYSSSCYYFSDTSMSWDAARDYCSSKRSTLVIFKNDNEWRFVSSMTMPIYHWIGLSDERTGEWEWVDHKPYIMNRKQWKPGQPDDWTQHGLGGGEDCAHLHNDGRFNDDHCSRSYRFVCQSSVTLTP